jgi:Leu/Phe-tRNA-protein transferase
LSQNFSKKTISVILQKIEEHNIEVFIYYHFNNISLTAVLRNPEKLNGRLITGSVVNMNLYTSYENSLYQEAELILKEEDLLPESFITCFINDMPYYSTYFGLVSKLKDNKGRYYMLLEHEEDGLILCSGQYEIINNMGHCYDFDNKCTLRYELLENYFYYYNWTPHIIEEWEHDSAQLQKPDSIVSIKDMNMDFRNRIAGWIRYEYFYTDDWSPEFYRTQAKLGFIAITEVISDYTFLAPQLQSEYAILDWKNLHISKKIKKIMNSSRIQDENIRLNIDINPKTVLSHIENIWESQTWLTSEYTDLIKRLASPEEHGKDRNFRIWGVTLTAGKDNIIIAGELGYSIGKTYTSLTGFFYREDKKYNNFGKLQMILLARVLEKGGFAFWNLGHPYMNYKTDLGAEIIPRGKFLQRWDEAVNEELVVGYAGLTE